MPPPMDESDSDQDDYSYPQRAPHLEFSSIGRRTSDKKSVPLELANSSTNPNLHKHQKSDPSFTLNATQDFSLEHGNAPLSSTPQVCGNGIMQNLQREQIHSSHSSHDVTPHLPNSRSVHDKQFMVIFIAFVCFTHF